MTQHTPPQPAVPLDYHVPEPPRRGRVGACLVMMAGVLGLVFLGGCFMIGIMEVNFHNVFAAVPSQGGPPAPNVSSAGSILFTSVLYIFAFSCLAGAVILFVSALTALRRIALD